MRKIVLVMLLVTTTPAHAGNFEGGWGAKANADRAMRPGGDWNSWCCASAPETTYSSPDGNFAVAAKRAWGNVTGWFGKGRTNLGEPDYSAPSYGIGYGSGGGSGGTATDGGSGGTAGS